MTFNLSKNARFGVLWQILVKSPFLRTSLIFETKSNCVKRRQFSEATKIRTICLSSRGRSVNNWTGCPTKVFPTTQKLSVQYSWPPMWSRNYINFALCRKTSASWPHRCVHLVKQGLRYIDENKKLTAEKLAAEKRIQHVWNYMSSNSDKSNQFESLNWNEVWNKYATKIEMKI